MASQAVSNPDAEAISVTFDLIDFGRTGEISEAALAQSLLQTGCTHAKCYVSSESTDAPS